MIGDTTVQSALDEHCAINIPNCTCRYDGMMDPVKGPSENAILAAVMEGKQGSDVIADKARDCIWEEVIIRRKGSRTTRNRTGPRESSIFLIV